MRRNIVGLAVALAAGFGNGVQAQAVSAVDWSGFYVGGFLGGVNGESRVKTATGVLQYFDATDSRQIARAGDNGIEQWRPSGGVAGGYSRQFGRVVVGLEASANTLFLDDDHSVKESYVTVPTATFTLKQSVKADWMATLRPRLGWAQDNWLGYVTAGVAVTRLKLDALLTDTAFNGFSKGSKERYVAGWSLGFGGEYALSGNWALKGEYLFTRFEEIKTVSQVTSTNNSGGTLNHTAELDIHAAMFGVTYRFK
jgi:outer membrane immunogenic protein